MGRSVGIRELGSHASTILRRVRKGEAVTLTDQGRPVAVIVPLVATAQDERLRRLVKTGRISWSGGKPAGSAQPGVVGKQSVAEAVVEDRR